MVLTVSTFSAFGDVTIVLFCMATVCVYCGAIEIVVNIITTLLFIINNDNMQCNGT